jgi:hypothetical protein
MRPILISVAFGLFAIGLFALVGCNKGKTSAPAAGQAGAAHSHHHDHGLARGPNGGHIIGMDNEKYHGELTHDAATHRIGVHLLGEDAATAAPIDAQSATIDVSIDGKSTQYSLPAVAQPSATAGKSSYFEIVSEPLETVIFGQSPSPDTEVQLSVAIDGKPTTGDIDARHIQDASAALLSPGSSEADALVWNKEVGEQDFKISLGHHGSTLLAGSKVEPAVQITREGKPVADAKVFNALLDADGKTALVEEVATVYEPPTTDEPSHYAQGSLKIPSGTRQAVIRYRIVLPEGKGEHTYDVPATVK